MDLVTMLRNYAGMSKTGAIERMLMTEAADRIEKGENMGSTLQEDRAVLEEAMSRIGENSEIWQDRVIYTICKSINDIITKIEKEESNVSE